MRNFEPKVREFIVENFLFGQDDGFANDASFLERGIIDSTGVLELVDYIEEVHGVKVEDDELVPENLDSVASVATFLEKKLAAAS